MRNNHKPEIRFLEFTEEWEQLKLGEIIEISSASRVHKNEWKTSGVRFFRSSDVVSNFHGKKNTPAFISNDLYGELSKKSGLVEPGDILVTGGGSIGIPYLVADHEPLYFKDADLIWLKSANKIDGYFLYSYFVTPQLRKYISSITHVGTISHYTIEQAKDTPIILPERVEQTIIGSFFKQLDETITLHQQELTTLKQTKQGFLQKIFSQEIRFKKDNGEKFSEWKEVKLKSICHFSTGKSKNKHLKDDGKYYVMDMGAVSEHGKIISKKKVELDQDLLNTGDLIMPKDDIGGGLIIGKTAYIDENEKYVLGDHVYLIRMNEEKCNPLFAHFQFNSSHFNRKVKRLVTGSAQLGITSKNVQEEYFSMPPYEEQQKIANFLARLDDVIALHQRELDSLKETKKAFLQKMFV